MMVSSNRVRFVVVGTFMCYLLSVSSLQVIGIYMTALIDEFDVGSSMLGLICSFGFAVQCVTGPFASVIVSRYGYRWAVMGGGAIEAFGIIMSYFATSTTMLLIFLGIVPGIGASMIYVSGPVIIASYFPKRYSTVFGIVFAGVGAGIFMFPPLIEELIAAFGWRNALLIHGALIFNTTAMGALFKPMPIRDEAEPCNNKRLTSKVVDQCDDKKQMIEFQYCQINDSKNLKDSESFRKPVTFITEKPTKSQSKCVKWSPNHILLFINTPTIVFAYMATFCANGAFTAAIVHTSNQIVQNGYSEREGALALSLLGVGSLVGRIFHGAPVDAKLIYPSTLYVLSFFFAAAATFLNPIVSSYVGCIVSATCTGIASGVYFPINYTIMRRMVGTSQLATATGVELFVDCWAIMAGGYLAGAIRDMTGNYAVGFYAIGATYLLGACSVFPIMIQEKREMKWNALGNSERETMV